MPVVKQYNKTKRKEIKTMDRNSEIAKAGVPTITYNRSTFRDTFTNTTTFNLGDFVPFFVDTQVQPGDTYSIDTSIVTRLNSPKTPTMGNLDQDIYWFSLPWWVVWEHAKEFWGENKTGAWAQTVEYTVPRIYVPNVANGNAIDTHHTLAHMGFPIHHGNYYGTAIALRALYEIWNYWFRDQTVTAPILYSHGDADLTYTSDREHGGQMLKVCKHHDYFTSLIPEPAKGTNETISLGTTAPIYGNGRPLYLGGYVDGQQMNQNLTMTGGIYDAGTGVNQIKLGTGFYQDYNGVPNTLVKLAANTTVGLSTERSSAYVDLSQAVAATINAMRVDVAMQHIKEKDAIFGTRYGELTEAHWGVQGGADILQIAEYLGGKRVPLEMQTVLQTSATPTSGEGTQQGYTGAFSVTADADKSFTKSFTVHSILIGVMCVRQDHQYSQGLASQFSKFRKYDYYWNELANIGYQPVYKKEIYTTGTSTDNEVLGYKPPYQEYRTWVNITTGEMNPDYSLSLDYWTYADDYDSAPVYSTEFLEETPDFLDRTLFVPSTTADNFLCDIACNITKISEVPQYGIPGLSRF